MKIKNVFLLILIVFLVDISFAKDNLTTIGFFKNHLSPNRKLLILEEWYKSKDTIFKKKYKIIRLNKNKEFELNKIDANYLDHSVVSSSIVWSKDSNSFYFVSTTQPKFIFKKNLSDNSLKKYYETNGKESIILFLSFSSNQYNLVVLEYPLDKFNDSIREPIGTLKVIDTDSKQVKNISNKVDPVKPIWTNNNELIFSKENSLHLFNLRNHKTYKLESISSEKRITDLYYINNNVLIVSESTSLENPDKNSDNSSFNRMVSFMKYNLESKNFSNLFTYRTTRLGYDVSGTNIIFPLSNDFLSENPDTSLLVFNVNEKVLDTYLIDNKKYDTPMYLSENEVLVRENNNKIKIINSVEQIELD